MTFLLFAAAKTKELRVMAPSIVGFAKPEIPDVPLGLLVTTGLF
ncbi:hypothetical protein VXQ18_07600 [Brucella abortus]|nr:hypothetical protein [Brucella abortus]